MRATFRAAAAVIVPESRDLDEAGWLEVERIAEEALETRPARMRRQLALFIRAIGLRSRVRYGKAFGALDERRRVALLEALQNSRSTLVRRGFWGFRTLILMGFYARPAAAARIGYRASARGWEAKR